MAEKNSSTAKEAYQKPFKANQPIVGMGKVIIARPAAVSAANQVSTGSSGARVGRLPIAFIRKGPPVLKKRKSTGIAFRDLPFVASRRTTTDAEYWHVPATGGYFGGYETGQAMARALLKFHRSEKSTDLSYALTAVVTSLMRRFEEEGGRAMDDRRADDRSDGFDSFRGQYVGFFNTLSGWLEASARQLGHGLDKVSDDELLIMANAGLNFDCNAYMESLEDDEVPA